MQTVRELWGIMQLIHDSGYAAPYRGGLLIMKMPRMISAAPSSALTPICSSSTIHPSAMAHTGCKKATDAAATEVVRTSRRRYKVVGSAEHSTPTTINNSQVRVG